MSLSMVFRLLEAVHKNEWGDDELRAFRLLEMIPDMVSALQMAQISLRNCASRRHRPQEIQHTLDFMHRLFSIIETDPLAFLREPREAWPMHEDDRTKERPLRAAWPNMKRLPA